MMFNIQLKNDNLYSAEDKILIYWWKQQTQIISLSNKLLDLRL